MKIRNKIAAVALVALSACSVAPSGPSVMAMPGSGKTFDAFKVDNQACRDWAAQQSGGDSANTQSTINAVGPAVIGAGLGAATGAATSPRHAAKGASVGAGLGLLAGAILGTNVAGSNSNTAQSRYDMAYVQCMSAKGNQVPMAQQPQRTTLW
ncbi:hypothetical protein [Paraburkholderia sp. C35]|uniref:YMGG-like glycine zipper-containing protein n=1 Tax=Paraburkholderia sp. C35 TaxID=2126993 RepID=UPI000D694461|nr:hypothetical protein [Paraburkholderia sp. C35]